MSKSFPAIAETCDKSRARLSPSDACNRLAKKWWRNVMLSENSGYAHRRWSAASQPVLSYESSYKCCGCRQYWIFGSQLLCCDISMWSWRTCEICVKRLPDLMLNLISEPFIFFYKSFLNPVQQLGAKPKRYARMNEKHKCLPIAVGSRKTARYECI